MPPSTVDLVRVRITRLLNAPSRRPNRAIDDGCKIIYTINDRTFEITVKEVEDT